MKATILLVEGKRSDAPQFSYGLIKKGYTVESQPNGNAGLMYLKENTPHLTVINAATMRTSGVRICQSYRQQLKSVPIILIVDSPPVNADKVDADVILVLPFTLQKLLNRMRPLLPGDRKNIQRAGPLRLDIERRIVRFEDRQACLTPRLVILLKTLMDKPGEVIEREELFRQVWHTDYIEDMRTLDVHISWLRQALEDNPRRPRFIKTVRGVGYRLDA
jgi:DNA-binding response OmpR family regulator